MPNLKNGILGAVALASGVTLSVLSGIKNEQGGTELTPNEVQSEPASNDRGLTQASNDSGLTQLSAPQIDQELRINLRLEPTVEEIQELQSKVSSPAAQVLDPKNSDFSELSFGSRRSTGKTVEL